MSWLFGILQKRKLLSFEFNSNEEFQKAETNNFFLTISKNNHSTFLNTSQNKIQALVGIPILDDKGKKKLFTNSDFLKPDLLQQENFFGHFVFLNYTNNNLEIFNDTFGLRDLYYIDSEEQFIFSTRIDLLSKYTSNSEINSREFSSLWLTNFQLSNKSIHKNIKRLGPAGKIIFNRNELKISNRKFEKSEIKNPHELFSETIVSCSSIKNVDSKTISLGLSGGIDSRLILASLLKSENNFNCYSLVNEETNDLKISEKICKIFSIEHKLIFRENLNIADHENEIIQYYKTIPPVIPLTQLLDFGFYGKEYLSKFLLLDGGFGEFYRRQFLKKLFLKGYQNFSMDNFSATKKSLFAPKPNIFNKAFSDELENNFDEVVKEMISLFKTPKNDAEFAEVLDLITLHYKLSNVYAAGQTILDKNFTAFMPLAQKDTVNIGLNISPKLKSDSVFVKNTIKKMKKDLSKINLVKNNINNPYYLNDKLVMIRLLLSRRFAKRRNYDRYKILLDNKNYFIDLLHRNEVREINYLNHTGNDKVVEQFFNGDLSKGNFVDWLLTFVYWTEANKING